jgi:hypothetical protein
MPSNFPHLDAAQTTFFLRQLEDIDARLYDVKYGRLEARELVNAKPINPGAESYTYRQFDRRGVAEIVSNYQTESRRVDVEGKEFTSILRSMRVSFGYNVQEIRAAQMAGTNLDAMKAMAARRAIDEQMNALALKGSAEHNLIGLFNQANAQTYTVPADGTASSALWSAKTADLILRDMFGIVDQIPTNTSEVERPTRLLLPYSRMRMITSKRMGVGDGVLTVLGFFQVARPGIEVRGAMFLDTAGAGSTNRMVAYDPDPVILEWLVSIPFESFPPQLKGMEYVTECHARAGGVVMRYPLSMAYGDGI